jgi:hypothetical protein
MEPGQLEFSSAVPPGAYTLRVLDSNAQAVLERAITVARNECAWHIAVPRAAEPFTAPVEAMHAAAPTAEPESQSTRWWILPAALVGTTAGLASLSIYAHVRANEKTGQLRGCTGTLETCDFAERRNDIETWDDVSKASAYGSMAVGVFGLALGGLSWFIQSSAPPTRRGAVQIGSASNQVIVTIHH